MALGDLLIRLSADIAQFQSDMGRAVSVANRTATSIESAFTKAGAVLRVFGVGVGVGAFTGMIKSAIDAGDQLLDLNKKTGITVERLSELKLAAQLGGANLDTLTKAMKAFNVALTDAQDTNSEVAQQFKALGVDIKAGPYEAFRQFAEAFSRLPEGATRSAVAVGILKKAGMDMIPVLADGAKGIDAAAESARKLGMVIGTDFAQAADEFKDNLTKLETYGSAFGIKVTAPIIGGIASISQNMAEAAENGNLFGQSLLEVAKFAAILASRFPKFTEIGKWGDQLAEALFRMEEARRRLRSGPNVWPGGKAPGLPSPAATAGTPNPEEVACAFSGGKWVNGRCVRAVDKAGADARQQLMKARAKIEFEAIKDAGARELALLEAQHSEALIGEREFWVRKAAIQAAALNAELKALDAEIRQAEAFRNKQGKGTPDYFKAQKDVEEAQARRAKVAADAANAEELLNIGANRAAREYLNTVEELNIQLLELQGNSVEAAQRRFALSTESVRRRLTAAGDTGSLEALKNIERGTLAQVAFNDAKTDAELITARLALAEDRIQNARRTGALNEFEALRRTGEERARAAADLEQYVQALERVAAENPGLRQLVLQAEQARAALEKLRMESDLVAEKFDTIFREAGADALADWVTGVKTAEEAFNNFSDSVVRQITRMATEMISSGLAEAFGLKGSGGAGTTSIFGQFFARLFGGGTGAGIGYGAAGTAAGTALVSNGAGGFVAALAEGTDYVPRTGLYQLHQGEAVIPREDNMAGRGAITINQAFTFTGPVDRRSQQQAMAAAAAGAQRALARNG